MSEEQKEELKLTFTNVDVTRVNLQPGDVLMVTVKSDADSESLSYLNERLQYFFPDNKIVVFGIQKGDSVDFTIASQDKENYTDSESEQAPETTGEPNG